ncbi:hypothetical protein NDU88_000623 [Pleurodeles waltl]|uniref:Uncharacterized protein n=1 Tax=Pleurodeles waltl TaxID=8319 RepID=A0AAV7P5I0_PLEWA|nr:hypothetical protein NDU88_000623 [Pleurodeles waltl]
MPRPPRLRRPKHGTPGDQAPMPPAPVSPGGLLLGAAPAPVVLCSPSPRQRLHRWVAAGGVTKGCCAAFIESDVLESTPCRILGYSKYPFPRDFQLSPSNHRLLPAHHGSSALL